MWARSDLSAFGQFQSVLHVNAQVADRAVNLGMAEKDLDRAEIASRLVDDRCFRAPKRVSPVILSGKPDSDHPLVHKAGILPGAHVSHVVVSAREDEVVQRPAASLQPSPHRLSCRVHQLELNWSFGLLLNHYGAITDASAGNYITDPHPNHITAA